MSEMEKPMFSRSEEAGILWVPVDAQRILSVGISTGGIAEMRIAESNPDAQIVATTIDQKGANHAKKLIKKNKLDDQIHVLIEDVTEPLPHPEGSFDYVYARLVLHYLSKPDLKVALSSLHRVVKTGGKLFTVVRSTQCPDARQAGATYDPTTGFTTCTGNNGDEYSRYYHTNNTITGAVAGAGFTINSAKSYDEQLFVDFMRTKVADHTDNVIEVVATK
jgi:ubiquinone/menaquinone biosynthesis C-methylase UbiE